MSPGVPGAMHRPCWRHPGRDCWECGEPASHRPKKGEFAARDDEAGRSLGAFAATVLARDVPAAPSRDAPLTGVLSASPDDRLLLEEAIQEWVDDPFVPVGVLARRLFLSPSHFAHRFRDAAGLPPGAFAQALRIQMAKRLLVDTGLPVVDVAQETGYDSLGTFTTRFAMLVGLPPARFRFLAGSDVPAIVPAGAARQERLPSVEGTIVADEGFTGITFVGLFPFYLPARRPASSVAVPVPGPFRLPPCPPGTYHLLAAAFGQDASVRERLIGAPARVAASAAPITVTNHHTAVVGLRLRMPQVGDPPVVLSLGLRDPGTGRGDLRGRS